MCMCGRSLAVAVVGHLITVMMAISTSVLSIITISILVKTYWRVMSRFFIFNSIIIIGQKNFCTNQIVNSEGLICIFYTLRKALLTQHCDNYSEGWRSVIFHYLSLNNIALFSLNQTSTVSTACTNKFPCLSVVEALSCWCQTSPILSPTLSPITGWGDRCQSMSCIGSRAPATTLSPNSADTSHHGQGQSGRPRVNYCNNKKNIICSICYVREYT